MATAIGLDVGGANLKAAHPAAGIARSVPFALWKAPDRLHAALADLLHSLPPTDEIAVTMTGELCDCFASKREGVLAILAAVEQAAGTKPVSVYRTDDTFAPLAEARANPLACAASNWLALATFAGRLAPPGPALLIDVGSTTTDVIPLLDGRPVPKGRTDPERLKSSELVYKGVRRTPVCALTGGDGAAELFATTLDVFLVLGAIPDEPDNRDTADGRPATRAFAHARLARMLCADLETSTERDRVALAERVFRRLSDLLIFAIQQVANSLPAAPRSLLVSGSGEFCLPPIMRERTPIPSCPVVSLSDRLGPAVSAAACAHAVAVLAAERAGD